MEMNRAIRLSDCGNVFIIGKSKTFPDQFRAIAAHHSFINQSEEAQLTPLHSPEFQPASGGVRPSSGPANSQDVFEHEPHFVRGLSKGGCK